MKRQSRSIATAITIAMAFVGGAAVAGCGGGSSGDNHSTSHEELTEFLQDNPEFADSPAQSDKEPLGLER